MKSIKEKQFLVNMAKALGQTPDPALVKEIEEHNRIMESITPVGDEFGSLISQLQQLKDEVDTIKTTVEVKQQYFPKPPSLDDLMALMPEEDYNETVEPVSEVVEEPTVEVTEPENPLIDAVSKHITKEVQFEAKVIEIDPILKSLEELRGKIKQLEGWVSRIAATGPGSGEVNLKNLDDFNQNGINFRDPDSRATVDGMSVVFNAANAKFELQTISGGGGGGSTNKIENGSSFVSIPANGSNVNIRTAGYNWWFDRTDGSLRIPGNIINSITGNVLNLTAGTNITIAANGRISSTATGGGSVDLSNVSGNIIPDTDSVYNLGSVDKRWKTLYLANNTIDLGGSLISSDGTGIITISSSGAVLPVNSKVTVDGNEKQIALVGNTGAIATVVPFYTQVIGLNTVATNFTFGANPDSYVFTNFYTSSNTPLTQSRVAQFYF